jgi:hypothetical protein
MYKFLFPDQLPVTDMSWAYVLGEIHELFNKLRKHDMKGIINELCDVYTCGICAIKNTTGISVPLLWKKTSYKWFGRVEFFNWYFDQLGLKFKIKYLKHGGNYLKTTKRLRVVRMAMKDQLPNHITDKGDETP